MVFIFLAIVVVPPYNYANYVNLTYVFIIVHTLLKV